MASKQKTPLQRIQEFAEATLLGKSDLIAVDVVITGRIVTEEGTVAMVDLGSFSAPPREFKPDKDGLFSRGFYLHGKVQDPTPRGMANQVEYQIGCNVTACKSKEWPA